MQDISFFKNYDFAEWIDEQKQHRHVHHIQ